MDEIFKFVERYKQEKDFDEVAAYCFWYSAISDFINKKPTMESYCFYPFTILGFNVSLNYISDNDLKNTMIKFLNQQNIRNAQELMQKLYNSAKNNAIKEFIEIISKR